MPVISAGCQCPSPAIEVAFNRFILVPTVSDIREIIAAARAWAPMPMALATVIEASGSAPRPRGGHMLIAADGRFAGSISGGCVEYDVFALAEKVIRQGRAEVHHYGSIDPASWQPGLPCGGQIGVMIQPVGSSGFPPVLFEQIAAAHANRQSLAISTDLITGMSVAGEVAGKFLNIYTAPPRILVVGAVQIAQSLSAILGNVGYAVTVNDPRDRFLTAERFPGAALSDDWPDAAVLAFKPTSADAVVTLSHDIKIDDPALLAALGSPAGYIGALGSRANHARRLVRLASLGASPENLPRIDGPAGLPIGGLGPQEIALSIAAGVVSRLRSIG